MSYLLAFPEPTMLSVNQAYFWPTFTCIPNPCLRHLIVVDWAGAFWISQQHRFCTRVVNQLWPYPAFVGWFESHLFVFTVVHVTGSIMRPAEHSICGTPHMLVLTVWESPPGSCDQFCPTLLLAISLHCSACQLCMLSLEYHFFRARVLNFDLSSTKIQP